MAKSSNPSKAAIDGVEGMMNAFKDYTLSTRRKAWKMMSGNKGSKEISKILSHPVRSKSRFKNLSFREWIEIHSEKE